MFLRQCRAQPIVGAACSAVGAAVARPGFRVATAMPALPRPLLWATAPPAAMAKPRGDVDSLDEEVALDSPRLALLCVRETSLLKSVSKPRDSAVSTLTRTATPTSDSTCDGSSTSRKRFSTLPAVLSKSFAMDVTRGDDEVMLKNTGSDLLDRYIRFRKLGEGSFGEVWLCRNRFRDELLAVKTIPFLNLGDDEAKAFGELDVFRKLTNPYIAKLHEVYREPRHIHLVMDYCAGGDLHGLLRGYWKSPALQKYPEREEILNAQRHRGLPVDLVARYVWQMLVGISYMHHNRFCHRDIKLDNYMLSNDIPGAPLKLIDFGLATSFQDDRPLFGKMGTPSYMAPEVVQDKPYGCNVDVWSVGVCAYMLSIGFSPWPGTNPEEIMQDVATNNQSSNEKFWQERSIHPRQAALVRSMMVRDPARRPKAKEVVNSSKWLQRAGPEQQDCCVIV